jgi:hypothetical protein
MDQQLHESIRHPAVMMMSTATASPEAVVERFLVLQSNHEWKDALALLSDGCLQQRWGLFQQFCHDEAAIKYGYESTDTAKSADPREFVGRMLQSSGVDAPGSNPSAVAIPGNSDCHLTCRGDDVIVTMSTAFTATRTCFRTKVLTDGRRVIAEITTLNGPPDEDLME